MIDLPLYNNGRKLIYTWEYKDKDGKPIGIVARYQDGSGCKDIVPFFKRKGSSFTAGIDLKPRPLYGLDKLSVYPKEKSVFITEGEKSTAALHGIDICAVTSLGGAQAANKTDWTPLNGQKMVFILPDNDAPGKKYAEDVSKILYGLESPPVVKLVRLPNLPEGGDIVDWLQTFRPDWDGYSPLTGDIGSLKDKLKPITDKAEPMSNLEVFAGSTPGVFDGNMPNEIASKIPPVLALNPELIPEPFRPWLADVSHRMQTPTDFATVSIIVIVGSVIGAGCGIRPKKQDDWEVIPNVFGACIGRPSLVLKTPSMKEPLKLLERLQAEYGEKFDKEKKGFEFDNEVNQSVKKALKTDLDKAAKKPDINKTEQLDVLRATYMELDEAPEPTRRLFKTNETSIQSMTLLQAQNPRGILTFRDELTGRLVKWDREDGADERAYFLEGWSGNGTYTDYKITRGLTDAQNICISVLGGIQPDKLKRYLYQALQGNNDGLIQRFQLAVWPDEPKDWQLVDTKPNKADKQRAYTILQVLAEMDFIQYGATQSEYDDRPYFRFDDAAQEVFNEWLIELQTVKLKQEDNPLMVEHLGKFRSLVPSLALIFHCIDIADGKLPGPVTERAARLAVEWCKYLESHARRIYAMAESPEHEAAVRLADKIKAKALPSPFTCKMVYDKGWHGLKNRQEVEDACNILIDENWLIMDHKPATGIRGRPPLPEYHINPALR